MQISFNGIKNLYIGKKEYDKYGSYVTPDNYVKQGNKHYTVVKLSCNLTNDENGNDLDKFKQALDKSGRYFQQNCVNSEAPNRIDLQLIRQDIKDSKGDVSMSDFVLNGCDMTLNEKATLPMYTYMAHLTKKIANLPNVSDAKKYYSNLINQSVAEEACKFIELC